MLAPPPLPVARSRAQAFDDLVLDAVERLERRWETQLRGVEFAVEDVPPAPAPGSTDGTEVPLGRVFPAVGRDPARVVVFRRPVELRASPPERPALVHDVVVEQVAELLGLEPEAVDPDYDPEADEG